MGNQEFEMNRHRCNTSCVCLVADTNLEKPWVRTFQRSDRAVDIMTGRFAIVTSLGREDEIKIHKSAQVMPSMYRTGFKEGQKRNMGYLKCFRLRGTILPVKELTEKS